jgi:hypothetical protein
VLKVFPFGSGSEFTASYAVTSSLAQSAAKYQSAVTSSNANIVLTPVSGSRPAVEICAITFSQYQQILAGTHVENCLSGVPSGSQIC